MHRIIWNRTDSEYLLLNGANILGAFPSKQDATLAQLQREAPQALAVVQPIIQAYPKLTSRAVKAVQLVQARQVHPTPDPNRFHVGSQADDKAYEVDVDISACSCPDWEHRAPTAGGRTLCKHILAALIFRKLRPSQRPDRVILLGQ